LHYQHIEKFRKPEPDKIPFEEALVFVLRQQSVPETPLRREIFDLPINYNNHS